MKVFWFIAATVVPLWAARAGDSLGRGIPSDYFLYLRHGGFEGDTGEGPALFSKGLARVADAARKANLVDAFLEELVKGRKPDSRTTIEEELSQWRRVLGGVDWDQLLGGEMALGARYEIAVIDREILDVESNFDWLALFRVDPGERDQLLHSIRRIVIARSTLGGFEVIDARREGVPTTILTGPDGRDVLCISGQDDVLAISSSAWEMRRAFQLLRGKGSGRGIIESEEYARLMKGLPAPETGELLLRPSLLFGELDNVASAVEKAPVRNDRAVEDVAAVVRILKGITGALDIINGIAVSGTSEGSRLIGSFRIELTKDAPDRTFYPALHGRPALGDFARLVPRDATAFTVTSGLNLEALHDGLVEFLLKVFPDGRLLVDRFRRMQEEARFNLKEDLLSLIGGRLVGLYFPREGGSGDAGGPGDLVVLLKLKNASRAAAELGDWIKKNREALQNIGLGPREVELPGIEGTLYRVALPFPPGVQLTFGVGEGEFLAGTSEERIRESLLVRKEKVETILANPTFQSLQLKPAGDPTIVFYRNLRRIFQEARGGLKWLSPLAAMLPRASGDEQILRSLLLVAPRLDPVLDALGFLNLAGGYLEAQGKEYRGQVVVTLGEAGGEKKTGEKPPRKERRTF